MIDISECYIKMLEKAPRELTKPYRVSDHNTIREYRLQILWCTKHRMFIGKDYTSCNECEGMMKAQEKVWRKADKLKTDVAKDKIYKAFSESDDDCDDKHWIRVLRQDEWQEILGRYYAEQDDGRVFTSHYLKVAFLDFVRWMGIQYHSESLVCVPTNCFDSGEQLWCAFTMQEFKGLVWDDKDWIKEKSNGRK